MEQAGATAVSSHPPRHHYWGLTSASAPAAAPANDGSVARSIPGPPAANEKHTCWAGCAAGGPGCAAGRGCDGGREGA
jgi:hypothetical protein